MSLSMRIGLLLMLSMTAFNASAEKADREQPINLEADAVTVNDAKKTSIYTGNVIQAHRARGQGRLQP